MDNKEILLSFGQRVKSLRLQKGLSQEQLAMQADLDRTYISGIERGIRNVSLVNLCKLAKSLNIKVSELTEFSMECIGEKDQNIILK